MNVIYNEDCLVGLSKMEDNSVDSCFTSPPYNRKRNDKYDNYNDVRDDYLEFLTEVTKELLRVSRDKVIINIQQNYYNKVDFYDFLGRFSKNISGIVVWNKTNGQPSTNYNSKDDTYSVTNRHEYFIVLTQDGKKFRANNPINSVVTMSSNSGNKFSKNHRAVMKKELADYFIENFTKKGDTVLDPFNGIGTTSVSCIDLGRNYVGFELDKEYYETSLKRISEHQPKLEV